MLLIAQTSFAIQIQRQVSEFSGKSKRTEPSGVSPTNIFG